MTISRVWSPRRGPAWTLLLDEHHVVSTTATHILVTCPASAGRDVHRLKRADLEQAGRTWHASSHLFFGVSPSIAGNWGDTPTKPRRPIPPDLVLDLIGVELGMWEGEESFFAARGYYLSAQVRRRLAASRLLVSVVRADKRPIAHPDGFHRRAIDSRRSVERLVEAWARGTKGVTEQHVRVAAEMHHERTAELLAEAGVLDLLLAARAAQPEALH